MRLLLFFFYSYMLCGFLVLPPRSFLLVLLLLDLNNLSLILLDAARSHFLILLLNVWLLWNLEMIVSVFLSTVGLMSRRHTDCRENSYRNWAGLALVETYSECDHYNKSLHFPKVIGGHCWITQWDYIKMNLCLNLHLVVPSCHSDCYFHWETEREGRFLSKIHYYFIFPFPL